MRHTLPFCLVALTIASTADAGLTSIYRTNTNNDVSGSYDTYSSLSNLASGSGLGINLISPSLGSMRHTYIFGDFVQSQTADPYMYRTVLNSNNQIHQIIRFAAPASDPMANLRTNTGGQVFTLSQAWSWEDDFFHDGTAFYRNATGSGSNGATRYATFTDLVNNTNGTSFNYSQNYGFNDRFFGFEGKVYRTNTGGPGGSVNGFAVYNSFQDLVSGNVAQTINSSVNYAASDLYIAVPAPGAIALLGVAGLIGARRRR
jgi:hypothetical protein